MLHLYIVTVASMTRAVHRLFAVLVAILLVSGLAVAPVTAVGDVSVGTDDGVDVGPDDVIGEIETQENESTEGIDFAVRSTDDGSVGGDDISDGTAIGVDELETAGGDALEELDDDDVEALLEALEKIELDDTDIDLVVTDGGVFVTERSIEELGASSSDVSTASADRDNTELLQVVPETDDDGTVTGIEGFRDRAGEFHPTDIRFESDDIPDELRLVKLLLEAIPSTDAFGPEDLPVGGEDKPVPICPLTDIGTDDLPVGDLPGPTDVVPDELLLPGIPWDILTPEALTGIVLGLVPAPCDIIQPDDPPIDPTDLPDEPGFDLDVQRFGEINGGGVVLLSQDLTLNESSDVGPGIDSKQGVLLTPEFGDVDLELAVNDGEKELIGTDPRIRYNEDGVETEVPITLIGQNLGVGLDCDPDTEPPTSIEAFLENPTGLCELELIGLPNLTEPGDITGIVLDLDEYVADVLEFLIGEGIGA